MSEEAGSRGEAVRQQLDRIAASPQLQASASLVRFLTFTVEETLAGRGDQLKEYLIGVEVFHRGADFDPRIDPIVRVQARKLRDRLAEFYAGPGARDAIQIEMPKGAYVPVIRPRSSEAEPVITPSELPANPTPSAPPALQPAARRVPRLAYAVVLTAISAGVLFLVARNNHGPAPVEQTMDVRSRQHTQRPVGLCTRIEADAERHHPREC